MKLAAIVPGPWTGIAVTGPFGETVSALISFETGHKVDHDGAKRFEYTAAAVRGVVSRVRGLEAERVVIDMPPSGSAPVRDFAAAIRDALGPMCELAPEGWRKRPVDGPLYASWPAPKFEIQKDALVLLCGSHISPLTGNTPPPPRTGITPPPSEPGLAVAMVAIPRPPAAPPPVLALRIAGIDPGGSKLGLVIAEGSRPPLRMLLRRTIPVGERVPLKKPRVIKRKDGTIVTYRDRHSLTGPMIDKLRIEVLEILKEYSVERVVIEHIDTVHMPKEVGSATGSSIATAIMKTSLIDESLRLGATLAGMDVYQVTAGAWRGKIAGRTNRAELIPEAIRRGYDNWPEMSGEHERDAAGLPLWHLKVCEETALAKTRAEKRGRIAVLKALGKGGRAKKERDCECKGKKHELTCPQSKAAKGLEGLL